MWGAPPPRTWAWGTAGPDGVGAVLPQGGHPGQGLLHGKLSHPGGLSEGGDLRHGLRAGTQPSLLPASQDVGGELYSLADVQGADSLGRVDFVPADGQKIHSQLPGREGELQISLDGVGMQQGGAAPGSEQPGNAGQIRHRPGFVVYQHQGDQHRILPQSRLHGGYRHGPRGVGAEEGDVPASSRSFSRGRRTASCSAAEERMCRPFRRWRAAPSKRAQLSLSEPPEVKNTSRGEQPQPRGYVGSGGVQNGPGRPSRPVGGTGISVFLRHGAHRRLVPPPGTPGWWRRCPDRCP